MITLDEIERILRGVADGRTPDEHGRRVLRAAVELLPVVKAAEAWRDQRRRRWEQAERRSPDPLYVRVPDDVLELADAIDAMRERMGEK